MEVEIYSITQEYYSKDINRDPKHKSAPVGKPFPNWPLQQRTQHISPWRGCSFIGIVYIQFTEIHTSPSITRNVWRVNWIIPTRVCTGQKSLS